MVGTAARRFEGDNRRKELLGTLASAVAGMGWGISRFRRFLVKNGEVKHDRCMPERGWKISGKFVCKSLKNGLAK